MNRAGAGRLQSLVTALLVLLLTGLLATLSARYPVESDWTRGGRHALSAASREILDHMPGPIEVTSYARADPGLRELVRNFLYRYQRHKKDLTLRFIDPDTVPDEARNLGIEVDGELIIRYRKRLEHVRRDSEQEFTNALQRLLRDTDLWLAFIEGHGERSPLNGSDSDLSRWAGELRQRGLNLQPINLATVSTIPDNTAVLIIASPRSGYLPGEIHKVRDYLDKGGNLLWLVEPDTQDGLDELRGFLGLQATAGTIIDVAGQVIGINDPTICLSTRQLYAPHPALAGFEQTTLFPRASAVYASDAGSWRTTPLVTSASHTWLERGELTGAIGFDPSTGDRQGPLPIAVSLERDLQSRKTQRIAIVGDGDFLSNNYLDHAGNLDLGLRLMDWLVQDGELIAIPARTVEDAELQFSRFASIVVGFGLMLVLPAGFIAVGAMIWWRRRRL